MKNILIIYSQEGDAEKVARGIKEGAESQGHRAELLAASGEGDEISFHKYDLVIVGSPTKGLIKGRPAEDISPTLDRCKHTVGQDAFAFITSSLIGSTKALKKLMEQLEKQGCVVKDFETLKKKADGEKLGQERI